MVAAVAPILGISFSKQILFLLNTPQDILAYAVEYLNIYLLGLIFVFGFNVMSAVLNGLENQDSREIPDCSNYLNIILDPLFILVLVFSQNGHCRRAGYQYHRHWLLY